MRKEKICGIYKITNKVNGKIYMGQSVNILDRWNHHKSCCNNEKCHEYNSPFYRALRKYGVDNFNFVIIEECLNSDVSTTQSYLRITQMIPSIACLDLQNDS